MDPNVDHYCVLGLPSGEEGAKLTEKEISKAYKLKALELHPDKRPDDPNAHANFQMLKSSYEILKDEKARKLFDDLLRVKREQQVRRSQQGAKRQKMVNDLEERERAAFAPDPAAKAREEEERISRKLKEEIARIIAMRAKKAAPATLASKGEIVGVAKEKIADSEREKMLKVSWEKVGEDYYTAKSLRELFSKFGGVEDVVIKSSKKKGSALVVMATKDAAVAATGNVSGNLSNPLLVLPLQPSPAAEFSGVQHSSESDHLDHLVGPSYKAYEDSILEKVLKAAAAQKKK